MDKKIDLNHLREKIILCVRLRNFPLKHIFPSSHNSQNRIYSEQMLQKNSVLPWKKKRNFSIKTMMV